MTHITLILARAGTVIGLAGGMPWPHLTTDMQNFKQRTLGKPVIMGRKTWDSLPKKPLPKRLNIIITRNPYDADPSMMGNVVTNDTDAALEAARYYARENKQDEICVIGDGEIYKLFQPLATRVVISEIPGDYPGDTYFSNLNPNQWQKVESVPMTDVLDYTVDTWERR
jgi:dihydrofolate reductase